MKPILIQQELPYNDPDSCCMFASNTLIMTTAAIETYQRETILECLAVLRELAEKNEGLDYLQVWRSVDPKIDDLWFIDERESISALLSGDY